jgi:hypothetical protein
MEAAHEAESFMQGPSVDGGCSRFVKHRRMTMKTTLIAAAFATALFAAPAFADCAADLTKVDEAMKTMKLDDATGAKAKELMDKAKAAMDAKDEATCATSAKELMTLVGLPAQ